MVPDDVQQAGCPGLFGKAGKQHRIVALGRTGDDPASRYQPVKIPIHG